LILSNIQKPVWKHPPIYWYKQNSRTNMEGPSVAELARLKKELNHGVREYKKTMKNMLMTSRFNDDTFSNNALFREQNPGVGCIYCCPTPISQQVPLDMVVFVLEMNNTRNRIMGIGMVRNRPIINKYKVYENASYNRNVYIGKMRIGRDDMTEEEEAVMKVMDTICFKGNRNLKRGHGISAFPAEILYKCMKNQVDLVDFVRNMFRSRKQ